MKIKRAFRDFTSRLGFEINRLPPKKLWGPKSEIIRPRSTYAPWSHDPDFLAVYERIRNNTMVDIYGCYELWQLVPQVAHVPGEIVEIGVWRGGSGAIIASRARAARLDCTVYLCDTFEGIVKAGDKDPLYKGGELSDTSSSIVQGLVDSLGLDNVKILKGVFPDETAHAIPPGPIRLCHIDVDVYRSAEAILDWVWPRLSVGGLLVYDDYGFPTCAGIAEHVDKQRGMDDRVIIHNLNGHAVVVRTR